MSKKRTLFNPEWTDKEINPEWCSWLKEVKSDPFSAHCSICRRSFQLSNMGRTAITSHEEGYKHQRNANSANGTLPLEKAFQTDKSTKENTINENKRSISEEKIIAETNDISTATCVKPSCSNKLSLENHVSKEAVLRAEILWAMKLVMSHSSYNSFHDASSLFKAMFPDSKIGQAVTCSSSKMSYMICFGLSPYFSEHLRRDIGNSKFVICFDEALNKVVQKGQMDIVIRYWSESFKRIKTRYLDSVFLGHSTALDLIAKLHEGTEGLDLSKLLQLSMDGPNVNVKMARLLTDELATEHLCEVLDIGTCGLHVVHGAFRTGHKAANWSLNTVFRAMYQLFKNSPARRADYIEITGSNKFPQKFCEVRWVENAAVAERAIEVFNFVKTYIQQSTLPKTQTVEVLQEACNNKLILPQMAFYSSIATLLQPFLKKYQSSDPLCPFMHQDLHFIIYQLMKRFIKSDVMRLADTAQKCMKVDINDKDNLCSLQALDVGVAASGLLAKCGATENEKKTIPA